MRVFTAHSAPNLLLMFKEMARNKFKDFMAFILREVPSLHYTGQVKHRKAIGLSGLKNRKTDSGTNIATRT